MEGIQRDLKAQRLLLCFWAFITWLGSRYYVITYFPLEKDVPGRSYRRNKSRYIKNLTRLSQCFADHFDATRQREGGEETSLNRCRLAMLLHPPIPKLRVYLCYTWKIIRRPSIRSLSRASSSLHPKKYKQNNKNGRALQGRP
jgi:hypothetical protein